MLPVAREAEHADTSRTRRRSCSNCRTPTTCPRSSTEMLRLGNDRQGFRWFAAPGEAETKRVLLRVIGPPYYTLLRALDKTAAGTKGTVRAYLERAPRVWVEVGHTHPLAAQIRVADKQLLLIRAPREWMYLDEAPFQDVYDIMQFKLPASPVGVDRGEGAQEDDGAAAAHRRERRRRPGTVGAPRATPSSNSTRSSATPTTGSRSGSCSPSPPTRREQRRSSCARGRRSSRRRCCRSRTRSAFKPFWKLPNLFLPVGRRLHPTLRRDAVRKLLADDPDQVVWLYPDGEDRLHARRACRTTRSARSRTGSITSSRPSRSRSRRGSRRRGSTSITSSARTPGGPKTKPDKGDKEPKEGDDDDGRGTRTAMPHPKGTGKGKAAAQAGGRRPSSSPPPEEVKKPSEWKIRREELEKQFLEIDGGARRAGAASALAGTGGRQRRDAGGSRGRDLLAERDVERRPDPGRRGLAAWVRGELPRPGGHHQGRGVRQAPARTARSARRRHASLVARVPVARRAEPRAGVAQRPACRRFRRIWRSTKSALPVRAVWLAGYRLAQLAGADVLGLARVRDRAAATASSPRA